MKWFFLKIALVFSYIIPILLLAFAGMTLKKHLDEKKSLTKKLKSESVDDTLIISSFYDEVLSRSEMKNLTLSENLFQKEPIPFIPFRLNNYWLIDKDDQESWLFQESKVEKQFDLDGIRGRKAVSTSSFFIQDSLLEMLRFAQVSIIDQNGGFVEWCDTHQDFKKQCDNSFQWAGEWYVESSPEIYCLHVNPMFKRGFQIAFHEFPASKSLRGYVFQSMVDTTTNKVSVNVYFSVKFQKNNVQLYHRLNENEKLQPFYINTEKLSAHDEVLMIIQSDSVQPAPLCFGIWVETA